MHAKYCRQQSFFLLVLLYNFLFLLFIFMKFSTAKEHRDFFQKNGWIEFEGLLSNEQLRAANQSIDQVLAERLNISPERIKFVSSEKIYLHGRDVWRQHPLLQKFVAQMRFAEIATELIEKKPLRLGYDQILPAYQEPPFSQKNVQVYSHFIEHTLSLQTVSCLQGVACGLMIMLGEEKGSVVEKEKSVEGIDVFPSQPGNVIFFQPHISIDWSCLAARLEQRFYLVVYTLANAHYQLEPCDPHTHALKQLGYIFNDKLSDKLNPIVYR